MYFFCHIPKTAGTSFRTAAERYFGADRVVYDYGPDSPVTSPCIRRFLYDSKPEDKAGLYQHCQQSGIKLVAGHKAANRFSGQVGLAHTLTFVREPLERAFSEYLHFRREKGFADDFRAFCAQQPLNHQTRMLAGIPVQALGFVGVTERYDESLRLLNRHYQWQIRKRRVNRARLFDPGPASIRAQDREIFYQQNPADVQLYNQALACLEQRLALSRRGLPYVHGQIETLKPGRISGWAWWGADRPDPVVLEVTINGRIVQRITADLSHKTMSSLGAPRAGQVGFASSSQARAAGPIELRVVETGQLLESAVMHRADNHRQG